MLMPPLTWLRVLAPPKAAASTAFCRRVLFSSMCPPSRANAAIMEIATRAITISTLTAPPWRRILAFIIEPSFTTLRIGIAAARKGLAWRVLLSGH
ncbi:hypothetical protein D3C76_1443060 [compost metagenome]